MTSKLGKGSGSLASRMEELFAPSVQAMGYDLINLEYQNKSPQGGAVVRLFIDHLQPKTEHIAIEDCVKVDHGLTALLESNEFENAFPTDFTLEVSSPGVDRPLTRKEHFTRFTGQKAKIKTYRSLEATELANTDYFARNPKQKNFSGLIQGVRSENIVLLVDKDEICIPLELIAKANLDVAEDLFRSHEFKNELKQNRR